MKQQGDVLNGLLSVSVPCSKLSTYHWPGRETERTVVPQGSWHAGVAKVAAAGGKVSQGDKSKAGQAVVSTTRKSPTVPG